MGPPRAQLAAWVQAPTGAARGTLVLAHGVRLDHRSLAGLASAFARAGYRSVTVDLRGHGESSGRFLTYGTTEARDLTRVLDAVAAKWPLGAVGAYGFSYGAAVALELGALDPRVTAVVAVAPFASLREVVLDYRNRYLPFPLTLIPDAWFERAVDRASQLALFDPDLGAPVSVVTRSRARALLIHGASDTQVPPRHSLELARAAGSRAELALIEGATHDNLPLDRVAAAALDWYARWLPGASAR